MAHNKGGSSCMSIIIGTGSNSNSNSEDYSNCGTCGSGTEESDIEINRRTIVHLENNSVDEADVAPVYILQPQEITKNIDLMRTVAMLMEGKLQQPMKGTDQEMLYEIQSDIQRFPEAFQKFTTIIHQIQYLNVTTTWDSTPQTKNGTSVPLESQSHGSFIEKVFRRSYSSRALTLQNSRKKIMLTLLHDLHRVFRRYLKIQASLQDRLQRFNKSILKNSLHNNHREYEKRMVGLTEYDEDDPQRPLLSRNKSESNGQPFSYTYFLQRTEFMSETLRKTKRQAADVQDSIDVLRDLIGWDFKQAVSLSTSSAGYEESTASSTCERLLRSGSENGESNNSHIRSESHSSTHHHHRHHQNQNTDHRAEHEETSENSTPDLIRDPKKKRWIFIAIIFVVLTVLIGATVAAISLFTFHY